MYTSINEFVEEWTQESASTQKVLDALTDASLHQSVSEHGRDLGRIAWHTVTSAPGFLSHFEVATEPVADADTVPSTAKEIADRFRKVSVDAAEAVKSQWTDESLTKVQNAFGRDLQNGAILSLMLKHMIHHRGQMTVLMRQAGLVVPGVYGPTSEEWRAMGMEAPV